MRFFTTLFIVLALALGLQTPAWSSSHPNIPVVEPDPIMLVEGTVATAADLQALLDVASAKSFATPHYYTGITAQRDGALCVVGVNYLDHRGVQFGVTFKVVPLASTFRMFETDLSTVNAEMDEILENTPGARSATWLLCNGKVYLVVMIRS